MTPSPNARRRALERLQKRRGEPGRREWKAPARGPCQNCGQRGPLIRHHVVLEQIVRHEGGDPWDQRNAMLLGAPRVWGGRCEANCHAGHHHPAVRDSRISMSKVPALAQEFARELLGEDRAALYFARRYRPEERCPT